MNSHWIPPSIGTGTPSSLSNFPSFVSHYVKLDEATEESPLSREHYEGLKTLLLEYLEKLGNELGNKLDQLNNNF